MSRPRRLLLLGLSLAIAVMALARLGHQSPAGLSRSRILMGTVVDIAVHGDSGPQAEAAIADAFAEMERIERLMSPHSPTGDLVKLAQETTGPVEVAPETAEVIRLGQQVARASNGAFDLCLGRLKQLWGLESEQPRRPTAGEVAAALEGIGSDCLQSTGQSAHKKTSRLMLDLGGIAKGYAVDRAAELLRRAGIREASINAGGDIRLVGDKGGEPWRIGIQHPRQPDRLLATLRLADTAVVTSGDYERWIEIDGRRYHHLFDPKTGFPADRSQSVTVVASSATLADALATAAFVLGPQAGADLLQRFDAEGVIVGADGEIRVTEGLKRSLEWP